MILTSLNCIRGHRSSTCDHKNRALLLVRKRGRPIVSDDLRVAILPQDITQLGCGCSVKDCKCANSEIIHLDADRSAKRLVNTKDGVVKVLDPIDGDDRVSKRKGRLRLQKKGVEKTVQRHVNDFVGKTKVEADTSNMVSPLELPAASSYSHETIIKTQNGSLSTAASCSTSYASSSCCKNINNSGTSDPSVFSNDHMHVNNNSSSSLSTSNSIHPLAETPNEDFVFVPVGNGLYRKELRNKNQTDVNSMLNKLGCADITHGNSNRTGSCCRDKCNDAGDHNCMNGCSHPGIGRREKPLLIAPMQFDGASIAELGEFYKLQYKMEETNNRPTSEGNSPISSTSSPHSQASVSTTIAPNLGMSNTAYENGREHIIQSVSDSTFNSPQDENEELGLLEKLLLDPELEKHSSETDFYDIYFAPTCVIPGGCQCGDDCQCVGCSTHDRNRNNQ